MLSSRRERARRTSAAGQLELQGGYVMLKIRRKISTAGYTVSSWVMKPFFGFCVLVGF